MFRRHSLRTRLQLLELTPQTATRDCRRHKLTVPAQLHLQTWVEDNDMVLLTVLYTEENDEQ